MKGEQIRIVRDFKALCLKRQRLKECIVDKLLAGEFVDKRHVKVGGCTLRYIGNIAL